MKVISLIFCIIGGVVTLSSLFYYFFFARSLPLQSVPHHHKIRDMKRVAVIMPAQGWGEEEIMVALRTTLASEASFDTDIRVYNSDGDRILMRSQIEQVLENGYDLVVPIGSQAAQMTKELSDKRGRKGPILFVGTGDPVQLGLIKSPESSGNNLTGVCVIGTEWIDAMVNLMPLLVPHVKRIVIPYDPTGLGSLVEKYKQKLVSLLEAKGYEVSSVVIENVGQLHERLKPFLDKTDMVLTLPDTTMVCAMEMVGKLCREYEIALFVSQHHMALKKGATVTFGVRLSDYGVGAARQMRLLFEKGLAPSSIPIDRMVNSQHVGISTNNARLQGVLSKLNKPVLFLMENSEVLNSNDKESFL